MSTITALNVRLGMDATNFSQGADLARAEVNKVASVLRQSVPPAEKFTKDMELLDKAFSDAGKQSKEYANAVEFLRKKHGQLSESAVAATAAGLRIQKQFQDEKKAVEEGRAALQKRLVEFKRAKAEEAKAAEEAARRLTESVARLAREEKNRDEVLRRQTATIRAATQETERAAVSNSKLNSTVASLAATYISFQGAKAGIKIASDVEQASIAFEVMTGSAAQGKKTLDDLRKFAAATPITLNGAQAAARTLMAFGDDGKNLIPTLTAIGNIAGGNNERFTNLALAFAQTQAAGRLMGQEVLQMVNAGFNPLTEMSKRLGISMPELKKQMEAGGISAAMVKESFMALGGEGGRLGSMMDRMGKTAAGAYAQLMSSVEELITQMGSHLLPILASGAKSLENVVRATMSFSSSLNRSQVELIAMVGSFTATVIVIPKVISAITMVIASIRAITTAMITMQAFSGPKGWATIAAGAAVAAGAVYLVGKAFDEMNEKAAETGNADPSAVAAMPAKAAAVVHRNSPLKQDFLKLEHSLNAQVRLLNLGAETYERQQLIAKGMSATQIRRITELRREIKLAEERNQKEEDLAKQRKDAADKRVAEIERIKKASEDAFTKDVENAIAAARKHFELEAQKAKQMRADVAKGPGSGIEVGSADAVKFMADQVNNRIAASMPTKEEPTEKQMLEETRKQLIEAQKQTQIQQHQETKLKELIAATRETRTRQIR
jgi:tape measure domain-containing protein